IGHKLSLVKNQIHALVSRNLLDNEMGGISDWFGIKGLRRLNALPLPDYEKHNLFLYLSQVKSLVGMEEQLQSQLALIAKDRDDARLLMTIPGINYYTALGIVAEIGDVRRFPTKHHLCSYAADSAQFCFAENDKN
ncbi:MAG: transposase, partial [Nitrososphaerota archaeon]|nr:transposase [Nitrososphaerota archaeon]